ncbi:MAG: hypothetical protein DCC71_09415 [Proteobacteria bacterium]|nr:MAG: hypothetical protein DCC71_09415 [Pseudomonadota bacterium]
MRLGIAAALLLLACACGAPARPPDILLFSVDTLRRDALRAYAPDAQELPHFDALAAQSARFTRAVSTASWTLPAHASMLSGLHPDRHGATDPGAQIAPSVALLAERLAARGYQTIGITEGGYLHRKYGFERGFASYRDVKHAAGRGSCDDARDFLAAGRDGRPLFLFLQTYAVHDYFQVRPRAAELLAAPPPRADAAKFVACLRGTHACDAGEWRTLRALYAAELRRLDDCAGALVAALPGADASVVVVTSDHGEGFDPARGRIHHGGRLHEDQLRIPLLLRAPGAVARDADVPASLVDVMPTLLALAGAETPAGLDGRSLAPWLGSPTRESDDRPQRAFEFHYSWWQGARIEPSEQRQRPHALALIEGDHWYLRDAAGESLYDVAADPEQRRDLAAETDLGALRRAAEERAGPRVETPRVESDAELRRQLEALGYVQ